MNMKKKAVILGTLIAGLQTGHSQAGLFSKAYLFFHKNINLVGIVRRKLGLPIMFHSQAKVDLKLLKNSKAVSFYKEDYADFYVPLLKEEVQARKHHYEWTKELKKQETHELQNKGAQSNQRTAWPKKQVRIWKNRANKVSNFRKSYCKSFIKDKKLRPLFKYYNRNIRNKNAKDNLTSFKKILRDIGLAPNTLIAMSKKNLRDDGDI